MFREYYLTRSEYGREVYLTQEVEFKADEPIRSYVNETDLNGNGWQMMKLRDSVRFYLVLDPWGTIRSSIIVYLYL